MASIATLLDLLSRLSGTPEAEAKTIFAGSKGELEPLPIEYKYKTFADVFGKEPASFEQFKAFKKDLYNKLRKENPDTPPGLILHDIEQRLTEPVLYKLGATDLKDVSDKVQTAMGLTPEQKERLHQIYIEQPSNILSGGKTFPLIRERGAEPIPNVTEAVKIEPGTDTFPHENKTFFGLPFTGKEKGLKNLEVPPNVSPKDAATREYYENVNPVAKIGYNPYKKITESGSSYPHLAKNAATAFHEALHQYNDLMAKMKASKQKNGITISPEYTHSETIDPSTKLKGKDAEYENAMKKLKFGNHFTPEMVKGKPEYAFDYWLSRMAHPEWLEGDVRPMATPTPTPVPEKFEKINDFLEE